jgi:hypothetical protein
MGRGFCSAHYSKFLKYGDPLAGRINAGGECDIEGCILPVHAFRMCAKHYGRYKKHGDAAVVRKVKRCAVHGCEEKYRANGFCQFHNGRNRRLGDPLAGGPKRILDGASSGPCAVDGCSNGAMARHLCAKHYRSLRKFGDPLVAKPQDGRSKVWHIQKGGYVMKFDRSSRHAHPVSGIVYQHRQVMGEVIGRPLRENESVHHKNGNRSDNRKSNLELWSKGQPAGQRVQDQVKWAREIIKEYGALFK